MNTKNVKTKAVTKKQVTEEITKIFPELMKVDNDLAIVISKAVQDKKTTVSTLSDLYKQATDKLAKITIPAEPIENEVKTNSDADTEEVAPTEEKKTPAKSKKNSGNSEKKPSGITRIKKTGEKKESPVKAIPQTEASLPVAVMFPAEFEVKDLGKLKAVPDNYKTIADISKAIESGKQFYIATYWTARQIKEYSYAEVNAVKPIKAFPNDLDILEPVYSCDTVERIWAVSIYTDAMFRFDSDCIQHIEDTNPYTKEKFRVRVSNGMEFELYEVVTE